MDFMDKVSFYNIDIKYQDSHLVYNTFSDSLIYLTANEFEIIKDLMSDLETFKSEYSVLYESFKKAGFIIDDYDEFEYIRYKNRLCIFEDRSTHLTINPTLDCNLNCWYCSTEYAKAYHHGGMSSAVMKSVQRHITNLVIKEKIPALHLDWFGGEPLMYYNEIIRPITLHSLQLVHDNNVRFSQHITTNSVYMTDEMIADMAVLHFDSFQIPLDGNEKHHNLIKYNADKTETFKSVIHNINTIADIIQHVNITLRVNYDKKTLYGIEDIIPLISEKAKRCIHVDFQKVWQVVCDEKDIKQLEIVKRSFSENGLYSGYWAYTPKRFNRCYADKIHQYAINYDGRIFKCTAQNYGDDKVIGILQEDGTIIWKDKLLSELFAHSTFDNERCRKCKFLPICMGPCIIKNYEARKNMQPIPCVFDYTQFSFESYVIEKARQRNIIQ